MEVARGKSMSNADYTRHPAETGGSDALVHLALDLRWTWDHATDELWEQLDPELWDRTHNPWAVLQSASAERLRALAEDKFAQQLIAKLLEQQAAPDSAKWFRKRFPDPPLGTVAYFSMEYMLSEALPISLSGTILGV
jgi:glycogen phosphorylase